mgnify:FL=1
MTFLRDRQLRWYLILQLLLCVFLLAAGILTLNGGTVSGGVAAGILFVSVPLLLGGTLFFLHRRSRLYQQAAEIVRQYMDGDFSSHLPQNQEGDLFQLFSEIEQLSTMLQSKNEAEHKNKEFLKSTISDISHQLKTPLAALMMYQEILESEPENSDTVREFASKMGASLQRMEQLIQSMLKITRLDSGSIVFERRDILVTELIDRAIRDLQTRADQEGKTIQIEGKPEERLLCDPEWTSEALGNLVKNALDHTAAGGHIRIAWSRTPAMLQIQVSDDGGGIAPEDIHHIFKRFYRSRQSLDSPGIGLGLPLAKSIVEGQGGVITAQSTSGEGATFTVSFLTKL